MRRRSITVAIVIALALPANAHAGRLEQQTSLVLAKWKASDNYRGCAETKNADGTTDVCMHWWADVQLTNLKTISGPQLPDQMIVTTLVHMDPRPDVLVLGAVRKNGRNHQMVVVGYPAVNAKTACVDLSSVRELRIKLPAGAARSSEKYCFSLSP
jgi:hypothetical protein